VRKRLGPFGTIAARPTWSWNIFGSYLRESGTYLSVTARSIPLLVRLKTLIIIGLRHFKAGTENPRVGGSIPSLATKKSLIFLILTNRAVAQS
jgi:hypothetical protein